MSIVSVNPAARHINVRKDPPVVLDTKQAQPPGLKLNNQTSR